MCTFVLKETVAYYTRNDSSVYCVLLDATKAFDRIQYIKLFKRLIDRKLPAIIIRFMVNLYSDQAMRVQWVSGRSFDFPIYNGVKQGAISSPVLFCIYIDELLTRLRAARHSCHVGCNYVGSMAYADDLTLLAPTAEAMRIMLKICSEYASEYYVSFNASKSRCMQFRPGKSKADSTCPTFFINDNAIEYVDKWPHLGNILDVNQSDSTSIVNRRNQMVGQINDVLCFFGKLDSIVKTRLLYTYCYSLYGSVLWDLNSSEIDRIGSAWRAALRRIWRLPYNAHNNIVSALGGKIPLFEELCCRTLNFHFSCLNSHNNVICNLARYTVAEDWAQSPHGRNLRFLCMEFNLPYSNVCNLNNNSKTVSMLTETYYRQCCDLDICRISFIFELIMLRNNMIDFVPTAGLLNKDELSDIINELCTN